MSYTVRVTENYITLDRHEIVDPFIHTRVRPRGPLAALRVLLGRYEVEVSVDADPETVEKVLELNPDYMGAFGSERRKAWDEQLAAALGRFSEQLPD